mmetsp:Transcript_7263/g.27195  ORF Transcript_7263/g.27195 Transcript_7263/m.27195 type:complete len:412 (-) Transcript_7263:5545-6780(-)
MSQKHFCCCSLSHDQHHPFNNIVADCCHIIFQYHIQITEFNLENTHHQKTISDYSPQDRIFLREFILSWRFVGRHVKVNQFLSATFSNRKPQLYYVDASWNCTLDNQTFEYLEGVHELHIEGTSLCEYSEEHAFAKLTSVHTLNLRGCEQLSGKGFQYLHNIHTLNLEDCSGIQMCHMRHIVGVKSLSLKNISQVNDATLRLLSGAILELNLTGCPLITDNGLSHLTQVKRLDISASSGARIPEPTDASLKHLGPQLIHLNIAGNMTITIETFKQLHNVQELHLSRCFSVTDAFFSVLPHHLRKLNVDHVHTLSNEALGFFHALESLSVRCCTGITVDGIKHMRGLKFLDIRRSGVVFGENNIGREFLRQFFSSQHPFLSLSLPNHDTDHTLFNIHVFIVDEVDGKLEYRG